MKPEQLKLYQIYKYKNWKEQLIYIGIDTVNDYIFLYKNERYVLSKQFFTNKNLNFDQIVKDLNIELNANGNMVKNYNWCPFNINDLQYLKPIVKDKLKNIINR